MAVLEVVGERVQCGRGAGVPAEVEPLVQGPGSGRSAERLALEVAYRVPQEATAQDRDAERALLRCQARGEAREGAAGTAGHRRHAGRSAQLAAELCAALCGQGVAAALRDDLALPVGAQQACQHLRIGLVAVRPAVHEVQLHAVGRAPGERGVERAVRELVAAHDSDGAESQQSARGGRGPQVVGVRPAEGQHGPAGRGAEVRGEFAPLVARQVRVDQVVALEEQRHAVTRETLVLGRLQGRREHRLQPGEAERVGRSGGHASIVAAPRPERAAGYFRRSWIRARMEVIEKPRGSTLPGCHSRCPMTDREVQW